MAAFDVGYCLQLFQDSGYRRTIYFIVKNSAFIPRKSTYVSRIIHRMNSDYFFNNINRFIILWIELFFLLLF
jgi:hypothetical protein